MDLKKTLIIGAAGMVLGGVMVIGGLSAGAATNIAWDKGPKIVNVSTTHKTFKDAQVQNLEVDAGNNLVEIVRGTEWGVKATGTSNKVLTDLQDKTLRIDAPDDNHHMIFSFGNYDPKVTVTVPFSANLDSLKITTTNGGMIVQGQNVKNTTVSNSNGGVRFENLQGEQLNITTTNGAIALEDTNLHAVHSKSQNSAFKAENLTLTDASDITSTNGMIKLEDSHFPGLDASTHNGYLHVEDVQNGDDDKSYQTGDATKALKIQTTNGVISIEN